MTYINNLTSHKIQYNQYKVHRELDIKPGAFELNKIKIKIDKGDSLQGIITKINDKRSLHRVKASIIREGKQSEILLTSSKQVNILDFRNMLKNIGIRIRIDPVNDYINFRLLDEQLYVYLAQRYETNNLPSPQYIIKDDNVMKVIDENESIINSENQNTSEDQKDFSISLSEEDINEEITESILINSSGNDQSQPDSYVDYMRLNTKAKLSIDFNKFLERLPRGDQIQLENFARNTIRRAKGKIRCDQLVSNIPLYSLQYWLNLSLKLELTQRRTVTGNF